MNNKLMINLLEFLEEAYPSKYRADKLAKRLELPSVKGEFFKIIKYLKATNKVTIFLLESDIVPSASRDELLQFDGITITPEGIDFLSKIKSFEVERRKTNVLTKATVVLALAGFIQALIYFKQFANDSTTLFDLLALLAIGVILIFIFPIAWDSLAQLKNY
ncbi:MAG: hypothetical protein V1888_02055 [archaeon]